MFTSKWLKKKFFGGKTKCGLKDHGDDLAPSQIGYGQKSNSLAAWKSQLRSSFLKKRS